MTLPLIIGAALVVLTVLIHGYGSMALLRFLLAHHIDQQGKLRLGGGLKPYQTEALDDGKERAMAQLEDGNYIEAVNGFRRRETSTTVEMRDG